MMSAFLVAVANVFAGFELELGAAIRALGLTCARHIQIDLGMAIPQLHVCFVARAKNAAMTIEVFGQEFNGVAHV
jgi:hypothetical protein